MLSLWWSPRGGRRGALLLFGDLLGQNGVFIRFYPNLGGLRGQDWVLEGFQFL